MEGKTKGVAVVGTAALIPAIFLNLPDPREEKGDQHFFEARASWTTIPFHSLPIILTEFQITKIFDEIMLNEVHLLLLSQLLKICLEHIIEVLMIGQD